MRLIDADVLRARLEGMMKAPWNAQSAPYCWAHAYEAMQEELDNAPTIEAEPVRHGRWMMYATPDDHNIWFACSLCNAAQNKESTYCPNCGARMDKEVQE